MYYASRIFSEIIRIIGLSVSISMSASDKKYNMFDVAVSFSFGKAIPDFCVFLSIIFGIVVMGNQVNAMKIYKTTIGVGSAFIILELLFFFLSVFIVRNY